MNPPDEILVIVDSSGRIFAPEDGQAVSAFKLLVTLRAQNPSLTFQVVKYRRAS